MLELNISQAVPLVEERVHAVCLWCTPPRFLHCRVTLKSERSPIDLWLVSLHHNQVHHPPTRQPDASTAGATRASSAGDTYGGT